jgi:hypothetical protein
MTNGNNPNRLSWAVTTLVTILLSICGATVTHFQGRVRDVEVQQQTSRERITAVETLVQDMKHALSRIEDKLDRQRRQP